MEDGEFSVEYVNGRWSALVNALDGAHCIAKRTLNKKYPMLHDHEFFPPSASVQTFVLKHNATAVM
jgi:hypothetical protein